MNRLLCMIAVTACFSTPLHAQYVGFNQKEIKELKRITLEREGRRDSVAAEVAKTYDSIEKVAALALSEEPHPIDTIRTEGLLAGNPKKTATQLALGDMNKLYALALVYKVGSDKRYLEHATQFLLAWARINHGRGDPIDDTNLDRAIEAYDMLKAQLPKAANDTIRDWLKETAGAELKGRYYHPDRPSFYNNWHSHRLKIVGEIAYAIGDTALQGYTIRELKIQLEKNLNPDGSSIDFVSRDALHYHVYDLEPLLKLAIVLSRATGADFYNYPSPTGSSIKRSVDWLLPYVNGQKTHPEFVNSTVDFDRKRAQNNESAYKAGTQFEPKNGMATLVLATYFDKGSFKQVRELMTETQTAKSLAWLAATVTLMRFNK
ncbi:MAG TPA: alginate lyase family protein [Puia sp.]